MTDLTDDLTPAELRCGIELQLREIERLQARVTHLEQLVTDATYTLSKARVWGGMDWSYHSLHPIIYVKTRDRLAAEVDLLYAAGKTK